MASVHLSLRRLLLTLGIALTLSGCAGSQPKTERTSQSQAAAQPARATPGLFLYEVAGPAGSVHLLGTIHLGFGFEEVLTPGARRVFDGCKRVLTEADLGGADPSQLLRGALLPEGSSLRALVGDATWEKLVARMGSQIAAPVLDRLEPWLPSVMLGFETMQRALRELRPGSESKQMDSELAKRASELAKEVSHLETVDEQIALFDTIPVAEQVSELSRSLDDESLDDARALLSSYAAGDEQALARVLFDPEQLASAPGYYERVLFERNVRWLAPIEREAQRGGALIAVGAAHLLGDRGVLSALAARGYRVRRVLD